MNLEKYTEYCIEKESNVKVYREDLINWVVKVWYADKLLPEMINKLFKASGVTLNSDGSEDEMFIRYSRLLGDYQEMVEEAE